MVSIIIIKSKTKLRYNLRDEAEGERRATYTFFFLTKHRSRLEKPNLATGLCIQHLSNGEKKKGWFGSCELVDFPRKFD